MQANQWRKSLQPALAFWTMCAGVCVASTALAKPPECPAGQRPGLSGCRSGAPHVRLTAPSGATESPKPTTSETPATGKSKKPKPAPLPDASLRPPSSLERADRRLLLQEIARLESLVSATHAKSPDRPLLLLRLAGAYAELAARSQRDHTRLEIQVEELEGIERATPANKQLTPETTAPVRPHVL